MRRRLGLTYGQVFASIILIIFCSLIIPIQTNAAQSVTIDYKQTNLNVSSEPNLSDVLSAAWFKGKLYVGVPPRDPYPGPTHELSSVDLRAEIWRYTPETTTWERVHQSGMFRVPLPYGTIVETARDMAYNVMAVHTDQTGEEALYIGTSVYYGAQARFLRTTDGETFQELNFNPGENIPGVWLVSFKSLVSFNGRLYTTPVTVGDPAMVPQTEVVFESDSVDLANGIFRFRPISEPGFGGSNTNIFEMTVFEDFLYVGIGDPEDAYQMWRTDASGQIPYTWTPVIINGPWSKKFVQISENGFGDPNNSYAWSMAWFKGKLYVGTVRNTLELAAYKDPPPPLDPYPVPIYEDPSELDLKAEIWQYTPDTDSWKRVHQSEEFPITLPDETVAWTARDAGYRSMVVYTDQTGEEALYVGTHIWIGAEARLLRTTDGENFQALAIDPGMALPEDVQLTSFRSLVNFDGRLYTTPVATGGTTLISEVQVVLESVSVDLINGIFHFRPVSEPGFGDETNATIFEMAAFNDNLYVGTGNMVNGYQVWRTDASGPLPYNWTPVIINGAGRGPLNEGTTAMFPFKGKLYVSSAIRRGGYDPQAGLQGPPELIRINPDDSWELVVGEPRQTPDGDKAPISGYWSGFGNIFTGYFWRMEEHEGWLYLGTYDNSTLLPYIPIPDLPSGVTDLIAQWQGGFDLWKSHDGVLWYRVTKQGFDNPLNMGVRTFQSTPVGLFVGTANSFTEGDSAGHAGGAEVWLWRYGDTPINYPPIADANGPDETSEGDLVTLNAHNSSDPDQNIISYEWDLDNDGQFDDATGAAADVVFCDNGLFSVGVRVMDEFGVRDIDNADVLVLNVPATVNAGPDQTVNEGDIVSLTSATFSDGGTADTHSATIDWGDGTVVIGTVIETPYGPPGDTAGADGTVNGSHVYAEHGIYSVSLTVTDDDGAAATDTFDVTVNHVAPVVGSPPPPTTGGSTGGATASGGIFTKAMSFQSDDQKLTIYIPKGTTGKTEAGDPLPEVRIKRVTTSLSLPQDKGFIGLSYDLKPDGATFDPPILVTFIYDPKLIPSGLGPENLTVGYYNEDTQQWVMLDASNITIDPTTNSITALISHFTYYGVIANMEPAEFTIGNLTIIPAEVNIAQNVNVSVMVTNTGDLPGSYEVSLKINGTEVSTRNVTVAGHATEEVTFASVQGTPGSYTIDVHHLSGTFTVKQPRIESIVVKEPPALPSLTPPAPAPPAPVLPAPTHAIPTSAPTPWWLFVVVIVGTAFVLALALWLFVFRTE